MRHLTIPTALLAGCLIAGAAWAQGSSGGSSGGSSSSASPSSSTTAAPSGSSQSGSSTFRPPMQGSTDPGNRASRVGGTAGNTPAGNAGTAGTIPPPGTEGSSGGPTTTGTTADGRLQRGERSTVNPSSREEKLLEEADKRVRRGICQGC
ncbi:hypothetical protein [Microvirga zambiensis]|uniref:hypothetical protein n=1 Tax=Microvirga zambiensis TaxID=1402137 RepID=UPI0019202EAA|nr:hypothetical protein [Microvirga zambiensis]